MSKKQNTLNDPVIKKTKHSRQEDVEAVVMEKIEKGKITLRSRYIYIAQSIGIKSLILFTIMVAIFFLNLFLYTLKANDSLDFLSFGSSGFLSFLELFPYELILLSLLALGVLGYVWKKCDLFYKFSFQRIFVALIGSVIVVSLGLTCSGMNEQIHQKLEAGYFPQFRPLYGRVLQPRRKLQHGLIGKIQGVQNTYLLVELDNRDVRVILHEKTLYMDSREFTLEQWIMADGSWQSEQDFVAQRIKHLGKRNRKNSNLPILPPPPPY